MSGTDGTDAAHREPHQDVGCGRLDIMQARRGPFQLSFARGSGISIRCFPDVTLAEAADAPHRHLMRVARPLWS